MEKDLRRSEYLIKKREKVLLTIKPICELFYISDYDYEITENGGEYLRLYTTRICCTINSIESVVIELIGYIFVAVWVRNRSLGAFERQTLNVIKQYWVK